MSARRLLLLLLLVFNALAFVVARGWGEGKAPTGEAERLASQLNRERIRLASEPPASTPPPAIAPPVTPAVTAVPTAPAAPEPKAVEASAPRVAATPAVTVPGCIAWKDLPEPLAATLGARLNALRVTASRTETVVKWWVRIPPQGSREQAERVLTKLRAQGVADSFIVPATAPSPFAVSLGLFKTEKAAQQLLEQLEAKGVRNAGIEPRTNPGVSRIEARLRPEQASALERLHPALARHRTDCAK